MEDLGWLKVVLYSTLESILRSFRLAFVVTYKVILDSKLLLESRMKERVSIFPS